ncbi:MAG: ROK family protein [Syntrophobacteraceae bacterium]
MAIDEFAIGVDLGGTKIALGIIDQGGRVVEMLRYETDAKGGSGAVIDQIARGVKHLESEKGQKLAGIGIGVAGQIDPDTGAVRFAPNLDWHDVPLRADLEKRTGLPVTVVNDVRGALWGEWLFGAGRGAQDLVCIFVGTGVGGGIVSHGRVLEGCSNTAGEIGHMTVSLRGPECTCGNRGCMEAIAGGWAIAKRSRELVAKHPAAGSAILKMAGGRAEDITARVLVQAYYAGESLAREIMDEAAEALAAGIASLVNAVNPCRIVLGGGIIEGMPELVSRVEQGVRRGALAAAQRNLSFSPSRLGNEAGIIGAAALALRLFGKGSAAT